MFDISLLSGIFISLLAGQFARIELINGMANVYIHEFLMLVFILHSFMRFGITPTRKFLKVRGVLLFYCLLFLSFILSLGEFALHQNIIASLYLMRIGLYTVFGIYVFRLFKSKKEMRFFLRKLIHLFSIALLFVTIIQFVFFPNFWGLYIFGWDPHLYRASAVYLDIFIAAAVYGLFAFYWFTNGRKMLSFFFVVALLLTFSRSGYVAFIVGVFYYFATLKKWKELALSILLFISLVFFVPKPFGEGGNLLRTFSISSRINDYKVGLSIWEQKPLFGFGYNRTRFAKEALKLASSDDKSHSLSSFHSSFMIILVTTGIVGFLAFIMLVVSYFMKHPTMRVYLVYILTMSLFDNVLLHVLVLLPLIFIAVLQDYSSLE